MAGVDPDHRVVARDVDGPVVQQPRVGDGRQSLPGVLVLEADGLVGQVAAGHHQDAGRRGGRVRHRLKEEMVQRCVRQEHADPGIARGHQRGDGGPGPLLEQHDRARRTRQVGLFPRVEAGHDTGGVEVGHHHGEGLVPAVLAPAQPLDRGVAGGVAGQVVPAQSLDGDDRPSGQCLLGGRQRRIGSVDHTVGTLEPDAGPTVGTCQRLGVEPSVRGIAVLRRARIAQGEVPHRRVRAVVGKSHGDGEPGSTVRAVDEGVAGTTVRRIRQLCQAVLTDSHIGRHEGAHGSVAEALHDAEPRVVRGRAWHRVDTEDLRQRGR